jgi:hypothetical protein
MADVLAQDPYDEAPSQGGRHPPLVNGTTLDYTAHVNQDIGMRKQLERTSESCAAGPTAFGVPTLPRPVEALVPRQG